jgi:plasmid stabilization system protein ParE
MPSKFPVFFASSAVSELIGSIERLADFPLSGRVVPEFDIEHLREITHPPFSIVYRCDRKRVRVIRIESNRMDYAGIYRPPAFFMI